MQQKDQHKQLELQSHERIEQQKMQGAGQDNMVKMQVQGQKAQESREAHQAHMMENQQKMEIDRQKAGMAMQAQASKRPTCRLARASGAGSTVQAGAAQMKQPGLQTP